MAFDIDIQRAVEKNSFKYCDFVFNNESWSFTSKSTFLKLPNNAQLTKNGTEFEVHFESKKVYLNNKELGTFIYKKSFFKRIISYRDLSFKISITSLLKSKFKKGHIIGHFSTQIPSRGCYKVLVIDKSDYSSFSKDDEILIIFLILWQTSWFPWAV